MLRIIQLALVTLITASFLSSCTPPPVVTPWDSQYLNQVNFSFNDIDPDENEIEGAVLLNLSGAPKPTGISHYVIYWSSSPEPSGKNNKLAETSTDLVGDVLHQIVANTPFDNNNPYLLLYLRNPDGNELFSTLSTKVDDNLTAPVASGVDTMTTEEGARVDPEIRVENVLFEFDKSVLREEFKAELDKSFATVEDKANIKVVISGHADERGSNEYNLALGERRAFAVKRYLVSLGLDERNISVISYGEEKPVDPGHAEEAWNKNRRAETDIETDITE